MKRIKKIILLILIIICSIMTIYFLYKVFTWKKDNKENIIIKNELDKLITEIETEEENEDYYDIDFEALKEINPDTVAYLKVNNTKIDYVVVRGNNNSYYLNHNFDKKINVAGWVFADYHNEYDGSDKNLVIFGHNMKNGSMFGTLKYVLRDEWYENKDNHKILLVDERGTHYYEVFSTYVINNEDYYINTNFNSDDDFYDFIFNLKSRSVNDYNVSLDKEDSILTLSTCSSGGTKRVVLHAKLIK